MLYRSRNNSKIIKHYNDSSNIYEIFNNTKKIEKHFNKKLNSNLINSNLNDLISIKNIRHKRSFSYLDKENENKIGPKKRINRKRSNLDLSNSKFNSTNVSSRNNTPINININLNNFSLINNNISNIKANLINKKSFKTLNKCENRCSIKIKNLEPFKMFLENMKELKNLKQNERTFRNNNHLVNTPIENKIFENHFIRNKNNNNIPLKPIKLNNYLKTSINNDNKINKIVHINPKIKKIYGKSKNKFSTDKKECKSKNMIKNISFLYENNEDFLLRLTLKKENRISIECLNTKEISKESEMFSNSYKICDILNISKIPSDLDLIEALKKLFDKYPPIGVFNKEQEEFKLKIIYDNNIKNIFILVKKKCEDSEFIKKNIDKKNNQDKKKMIEKCQEMLKENQKNIEDKKNIEKKMGIKNDIKNNLLVDKLLKKILFENKKINEK